jgi:DNA-binding CsgD family transcriptional regulator
LLGQGWLHTALGQPDEARRALVGARAAYGDQHWEVGTTLFFELDLVVLPYEADRLAERRHLADEAERVWTRARGALVDLPPRLAQLPLLLLEGRWGEARGLALATFAAGSSEAWRRFPARYLGALALAQGEPDLAWQLVREEFPAGPGTEPGGTWFLHALVVQRLAAALALDADDLDTARAWLTAHDRWLAWGGATLGRAEGQLGWAAYQLAAGAPAQASEHAARALAQATSPRQPLALLAARRLLGARAVAGGDLDTAEKHLAAALALADACAAPYERALTLVETATLRLATRDEQGAAACLAEVREICTALGAQRVLSRIAALSPGRVPRPPDGYPGGLTAREVEVLTLIAEGSSNREIADVLGLSVRTVDRHTDNLYRKIDARGRGDAVAFAARHGLLPH